MTSFLPASYRAGSPSRFQTRIVSPRFRLSSHVDLQVTVFAEAPSNSPPWVRLTGPTRFPIGAGSLQFAGEATDDGLPAGLLSYFPDGQLHTRTDFNGHTTTYAYDAAGRLSTRTPDASFASEVPVSFTYWPSGRRKTMADITGTTSYSYDSRDRLLSKSTPEGSLTYTYDVAGNRKTVQSDSGAYDVGYGYDALNRLASVTDHVAGGGTTTYHYDDGGRLGSYDYPNGISSAFVYDALNRVQSLKIGSALGTASESLVASYGYTFYPTGNRHTVAELSGRGVTWSYDNLWRLTNETIAGSAVAGSIGYLYDNVGNRLSRSSSVAGIANQTQSYDNNDRLLSDGWDPNGNTLTSNGNQHGYDSENRLLSLNASQAHYVYDGDGQLVAKTAGGVTTAYLIDSENPTGYTQITEERLSGAPLKSYVYGPQRISMRDGAGLHYYGYDAHSGVRLLLDSSGNVTDSWDYDAFGNVIGRSGSTENGFTYRGEQVDSALGLQYLRARWMDPAKGRFATRDIWEGYERDPRSANCYGYARQGPTDLDDPSGHFYTLTELSVAAGIGGILSGLATAGASYALNKPITLREVSIGAAIGFVGAPAAMLVPPLAAALGVGFAGLSIYQLLPVLADPSASPSRKIAGAAVIVASIYGAYRGIRYAYENPIWYMGVVPPGPGPAPVQGEPTIDLFHKGELANGQVSGNRSLSLGADRESVAALDRPGEVWTFRIPVRILELWRLSGQARTLKDLDSSTGVENSEFRVLPPTSQELNQYRVP